MRFVLDNSVAMCWLLKDGSADHVTYATEVLEALTHGEAVLRSLWALEAANVIAKAEARGLLTEARAQAFVNLLDRLNIVTDTGTAAHALHDTLQLARRHKLSAFDAAYLELALRLGAPLATLEADLARAAQGAGLPAFTPQQDRP